MIASILPFSAKAIAPLCRRGDRQGCGGPPARASAGKSLGGRGECYEYVKKRNRRLVNRKSLIYNGLWRGASVGALRLGRAGGYPPFGLAGEPAGAPNYYRLEKWGVVWVLDLVGASASPGGVLA